MRLYWGNGTPAKVFAATPLFIMAVRIVLSFGRVNKQRPTNEGALGTHQAQADVDWMAMTSCGGSLNYLCHHTAEKRKKCVCLCVWLSFGIISPLADCLQAYHPPDVLSLTLKMQELTFITFDFRGWRVCYHESHRVQISSQLTQLCLLVKSSGIMNLLVFSLVSIKFDLNLKGTWCNIHNI